MGFLAKKPAGAARLAKKPAGAARPAKKPAGAAGPAITTRQRGQQAEDLALSHLQAAGLRLVERNYRTPGRGGGEIDLILCARDGTLVFVEVRSRASGAFGGAGASIGATKRRRIVLAARHYLMRWAAPPSCRFDVVLVEPGPPGAAGATGVAGAALQVQWLQAAFDADGA